MLPPGGGGPFLQETRVDPIKGQKLQSKSRCAAETMGTYEEWNRGRGRGCGRGRVEFPFSHVNI